MNLTAEQLTKLRTLSMLAARWAAAADAAARLKVLRRAADIAVRALREQAQDAAVDAWK